MHQRCHAPAVDELQACQIDDDLVPAGRGRRHDGAGACQAKLAAQRDSNLTAASASSHIHAEHVGAFLRQQQGGVLTQRLAHQLHQNSTPHARACPVQARSRARLGSRWRPSMTGRPLRGWRAKMPSACWSLLEGRGVKAGRARRLASAARAQRAPATRPRGRARGRPLAGLAPRSRQRAGGLVPIAGGPRRAGWPEASRRDRQAPRVVRSGPKWLAGTALASRRGFSAGHSMSAGTALAGFAGHLL